MRNGSPNSIQENGSLASLFRKLTFYQQTPVAEYFDTPQQLFLSKLRASRAIPDCAIDHTLPQAGVTPIMLGSPSNPWLLSPTPMSAVCLYQGLSPNMVILSVAIVGPCCISFPHYHIQCKLSRIYRRVRMQSQACASL